ncbi:MAG: aromatic amino acid lyase [Deltaproteobacteria bacterium]|nr:MAG: aromatic amino acid lyase [Deltaproteobacteria bacterium]
MPSAPSSPAPTPPDSSEPLTIDGHHLDFDAVVAVARGGRSVRLADDARARMERSYAWVAQAGTGDRPVYGVNTGFGSLARVRIPPAQRATLSLNLVRSHAAGVGDPVPVPTVRAMMLLRANALAKGASGCRPLLVDTICAMLDAGVTPVVPERGSCGSSGDLAPLAHLGLVMAEGDHGEAWLDGERLPAGEAMARAGIPRLRLEAKDGLAITNGAQLTTAIAALCCHDAAVLVLAAELAAAMSIDALRGASRAFHPAVHALRPYRGARDCAANLRRLLAGSRLVDSVPDKVQDAYSLRCTPPVLGAVRDQVAFVRQQVAVELNAATDNPLILLPEAMPPDEDDALPLLDPDNRAFSAGLFHGEPVGMAMDGLKLALTELASISERRLYRLTTGSLSQRLPPALIGQDRPDLGMMLPQTTAAALVSECKALAWPATADSIPTCEDQEDHVAMSTTAARRCARVLEAARRVVAIELLGAAQALRFRQQEEGVDCVGVGTGAGLAWVDELLGGLDPARPPGELVETLVRGIAAGSFRPRLPALLEVP